MLIIRYSKNAENDKIISKLLEIKAYFQNNCPFLPDENLFEKKTKQPSLDEIKKRNAIYIIQGIATVTEKLERNENIEILNEGDFCILDPLSEIFIGNSSDKDLKFLSFCFLGYNHEIKLS